MTDRRRRRVLAATCHVHSGSAGFTNLVVTKQPGRVVFNPHAADLCVISIDDSAARQLSDTLRAWLA